MMEGNGKVLNVEPSCGQKRGKAFLFRAKGMALTRQTYADFIPKKSAKKYKKNGINFQILLTPAGPGPACTAT